MKEIEIKILEIDREVIEQLLIGLGSKKIFDGEMHAIYYDFPDEQISKRGDVFRLRQEGDELVLAYKAKVSKEDTKIMNEYETEIGDKTAMLEILAQLGFKSYKETRKFRIEYLLSDVKVVIDDYQGDLSHIPVFLEIEAPNEEAIEKMAIKLGFQPEDCMSWDTRDLVIHYG